MAKAIVHQVDALQMSFAFGLQTGRYPGEAKMARKPTAAAIEQLVATMDTPRNPGWES